MTDAPFVATQLDAVRVISINDAPYNRMSLAFMDELERVLPMTMRHAPSSLPARGRRTFPLE